MNEFWWRCIESDTNKLSSPIFVHCGVHFRCLLIWKLDLKNLKKMLYFSFKRSYLPSWTCHIYNVSLSSDVFNFMWINKTFDFLSSGNTKDDENKWKNLFSGHTWHVYCYCVPPGRSASFLKVSPCSVRLGFRRIKVTCVRSIPVRIS